MDTGRHSKIKLTSGTG